MHVRLVVLGFTLVLALLPTRAWADLTVALTTPRQGEVIGDEVRVEAVVSSTFQVGSVALSVGARASPPCSGAEPGRPSST